MSILKEIKIEVNENNVLMKKMICTLVEMLDVIEKRAERHYFDMYNIAEKVRGLEELLNIKWEERGVKIKGGYKKSKRVLDR